MEIAIISQQTYQFLMAKNWEQWCVEMEVIFGFQDVADIVKNGIPEEAVGGTATQTVAHKDFKKKDCKALFFIHQCLDNDNFAKISSAKSAKDVWDILEKCYMVVLTR